MTPQAGEEPGSHAGPRAPDDDDAIDADELVRLGLARPARPRRPWVVRLVVAFVVVVLAACVPAAWIVERWRAEGIALADAHTRHEAVHPGWSFPARVVSAGVADDAPLAVRIAEAKARGFVEHCERPGQKQRAFVLPPKAAGWYCAATKELVARDRQGLGPVTLGWMIGKDGELREHLPLAKAPKHLVDAILAAEDRDFRAHSGVSWIGILRAAFANTTEGGYAQGASTLDMQVARAFTQQREKKLVRKLREAVLAMAIDQRLGKDGVLQVYLDAPYLGQRGSLSIAGFQAAARHYYGKDAAELTLSEAATLASILPAPGRFAPDKYPERAKERRDRTLQIMASTFGYDVKAALAEPIVTVAPEPLPERHPVFLSAVRAWLEAHVGADVLYGAGLTVTASVDLAMQAETERLFEEKLAYYQTLISKPGAPPLQSASVLVDVPTGRIRAIYGGRDVDATSFNRATQARRQGGSAFKPLVYAMAMADRSGPNGQPRFTAATVEPNAPRLFKTAHGDWRPRNIGGEYSATACLAQAITWSQNIATASLLEELGGPKPLIDFATKAGFDTKKFPEELGLALGQGEVTPLEMAQFAAMVSNGGLLVEARPVLSAIDAAGVERLPPAPEAKRVLTPEAAALTRELMRMVVDYGTGGTVRGTGGEWGYQGPAMGKTGTTDGEKDLWFVGATPRYAAAVWLGYDKPAGLMYSASDLAAPLWGWWMGKVTQKDGPPPPEWPAEPKLVRRAVCTVTGKLAGATCHGLPAPFLPGTEPKEACPEDHPPVEAPGAPQLDPETGQPIQPAYESLWKRLAREKAEAEAAKQAGEGAPAPAP